MVFVKSCITIKILIEKLYMIDMRRRFIPFYLYIYVCKYGYIWVWYPGLYNKRLYVVAASEKWRKKSSGGCSKMTMNAIYIYIFLCKLTILMNIHNEKSTKNKQEWMSRIYQRNLYVVLSQKLNCNKIPKNDLVTNSMKNFWNS